MFYETAQTVGPGWHRSYKPSHYEDMTWTPSSKNFRSPGSSPETYRRIIKNDNDFPSRHKEHEDDFFGGRKSPTFPRRIFKEVWDESPTSNHRFTDRPRMFKRVFRPDRWEDEFERDIPHLRRVEREFDSNFDGGGPTSSRKFDEEFEKRFNARDLKKDIKDEFERSDGKVHHIPILVERRSNDAKSHFERSDKPSPTREDKIDEDDSEEWTGPQVQRLKKNFEQAEDKPSRYSNNWFHKSDMNSKPRPYINTSSETWDPHAIHTLPTRKAHKSSQSFDDSRHHVPPKYVYRSYSETHDDNPRQQQPHSAAFRSHSDGHCPKQTHVTKIHVNLPSQSEKDEQRSPRYQSTNNEDVKITRDSPDSSPKEDVQKTQIQSDSTPIPKGRNKYDNPSMQQIAVVLQNVEDLVQRVENYNGTGRDKHYRFLDEMLTRCMLRLDDVDTEGREDIRSARKAALREVQNCIDKLEAKADESERRHKESKSKAAGKCTELNNDQPDDKKAIPLQDKEFINQPDPNQAIPLPAATNESDSSSSNNNKAIPLGSKPAENHHQSHQVIPLGDGSVNEISNPMQNKAIPLGYTPPDGNISRSDSISAEQTKL